MKKEWYFDRFCGRQFAALIEDGKLAEFAVEKEYNLTFWAKNENNENQRNDLKKLIKISQKERLLPKTHLDGYYGKCQKK